MSERTVITQKAQAFFEDLWKRGDPWKLETSEFEQAKYDREITILRGRRYPRALEIGCGAGAFTRRLARVADGILALDISPSAIDRARAIGINSVDFRVANIMDYNPRAEGPWDLVVMNETICYLGWLYSFLTSPGSPPSSLPRVARHGQMFNGQHLWWRRRLSAPPWVIRTYRDLFLNVGYQLRHPRKFSAERRMALNIEVIISTFRARHPPKNSPLCQSLMSPTRGPPLRWRER